MSDRSVQADVVKKAILKYKVSKLRGTTGSSVQGVSECKLDIASHVALISAWKTNRAARVDQLLRWRSSWVRA